MEGVCVRMCVCMYVCVCVTNFFFKLELPQGSEFWCTTCTNPLDAGNLVLASPQNKSCPPCVSVSPFCYLRHFKSDCHAVKSKVGLLDE